MFKPEELKGQLVGRTLYPLDIIGNVIAVEWLLLDESVMLHRRQQFRLTATVFLPVIKSAVLVCASIQQASPPSP